MAVLKGYTTPAGVSDTASVKALQQKLNASGANIAVDGKWGAQTDAAYKSYTAQQEKQAQIQQLMDSVSGSSSRIGARYEAAGQNLAAAETAAYESTKTNLESQKKQTADQYDDVRSQAYVNARLNAVNNNEVLAAKGLAGNLYDDAQSGVSETSRIQGDVAMRNDINSATRAEQLTLDQIEQMIIQAGYTKDQNIAAQMAQIAMSRASAEGAADQNAIANMLALMQYKDSVTPTPTATVTKSTGSKNPPTLTDDDIVSVLTGGVNKGRAAAVTDPTKQKRRIGGNVI